MTDRPQTGDVFHYPYLWAWQSALGETEGRKDRPSALPWLSPSDPAITVFTSFPSPLKNLPVML